MSSRRRLACVLAVPLAFYVYACSSDSTDDPANPEDEGGTTTPEGGGKIDSSTPDLDSSVKKDTSVPVDAADASTACLGNPLLATAVAVTPDGGADGGVATRIVTAAQAAAFLDGPQWVDAQGGFLVYSVFAPDGNEALRRVAGDGGAGALLRNAGFTVNIGPVGNAVKGGVILTATSPKNGTDTVVITQTLAADGGALPSIAIPNLGNGTIRNPNDIAVHAVSGNYYFTDGQYLNGAAGDTAFYRVLNDGGIQQVEKDLARPNGIALSADGKKLFVGLGPLGGEGGKAILSYTVNADGSVAAASKATFIASANLVDTPDGIATDVAGNLWVAESESGGGANGRVEVFNAAGKLLGTIPFAGSRPTGIAFGGPDNTTVFVTTESLGGGAVAPGVFITKTRCPGVR